MNDCTLIANNRHTMKLHLPVIAIAILTSLFGGENFAQQDHPDAPLIYRVEAFAGQPFGIGSIRYRMRSGDEMIDRSGGTILREKNNRVFYPVFSKPAAAKFFNRLIGVSNNEPESMHTVWFLFRGDEPLELTLEGTSVATMTAPVQFAREKKFDRSLRHWWREFNTVSEWQEEWGDYQPLILSLIHI